MGQLEKCPLCGHLNNEYNTGRVDTYGVLCYDCGQFEISHYCYEKYREDYKWLNTAYHIQVNTPKPGKINCFIINNEIPSWRMVNNNYISEVDMERYYPKNLKARTDMVLLNIGSYLKDISGFFDYSFMNLTGAVVSRQLLYRIFYNLIPDDSGLFTMVDFLVEMGFLTFVDSNIFRVSAKGWNKIYELQGDNNVLSQAFIAMWFDPSMDDVKNTIISAIEKCGYKGQTIDMKEHNNQIVPEIFFEIKRSKFMIADITGHRNGVYYEAGYGEALGKEVIVTCHVDDFKRVHFDIAQKNTILWKDMPDLEKRLIDRIEATVGKIQDH